VARAVLPLLHHRRAHGWRRVDRQVKAGKAKFTDGAFVNALKFWQQMFTDGVMSWTNIQMPYGDGPDSWQRQGRILRRRRLAAGRLPHRQGHRQGPHRARQAGHRLRAPELPGDPGEKYPGVVSAIAGTGLGVSAKIPAGSDKEKRGQAAEVLLRPESRSSSWRRAPSFPRARASRAKSSSPLPR